MPSKMITAARSLPLAFFRALLVVCLCCTAVLSGSSSETLKSVVDISGPTVREVAFSPAILSPGDDVIVTWNYTSAKTTGDLNVFDIDLDQCGQGLGACECSGNVLISLCPETTGCVDSDGSYDLILEASNADSATEVVVGNTYQIRVSLASDPTVYACSPSFEVLESDDSIDLSIEVTSGGKMTYPASLEVIAPTEVLIPGQAFTARWLYDNGEGEELDLEEGVGSAGEFIVDLYVCADGACGDDSCGTFVAALCGDGCYDPGAGDYDVVIPVDITPGTYYLYVEELSANGPSDCVSIEVSPASSAVATTPSPVLSTTETVTPTGLRPTSAPVEYSLSPTVSPTGDPGFRGEPGSPGVPPTPVPEKQVCDTTADVSLEAEEDEEDGIIVRVAHASGNRSESGCVTMTKVWDWLQTANNVSTDLLSLATSDTGDNVTNTWTLRASLYVTNGVTLEIKGTAAGGDCDELRIRSSSTRMHSVIAHGGSIDIYKTKIHSWDEDIQAPHDLGIDSDGSIPRSYISCVSEIVNENDTCPVGSAQKDMGECRMDMEDSELGYLGFHETESYGISWKVRGYCTDDSNREIFDTINVWGNIINCDIHHMWYGMYSYGHLGGVWINNLMHDNHVYGFDPHDDSDYLTIHNNTVWNSGKHGIIASKRCDHVSIKYNKVNASVGNGIMLHRSCDDSEIIDNEVFGSEIAGIALVETMRTIVTGNTVSDGKWGIRLSIGAADNQIYENLLEGNDQHDFYLYEGADEPYVNTNTCYNNTFDSNTVHHISAYPINTQDSNDTIFSNNTFLGTDGSFKFGNARYTTLIGNTGEILNASDHRIEDGSCFTEGSQLEPVCS